MILGPSPLARGSRGRHRWRAGAIGSIPARAGQPKWRPSHHQRPRVHPRSRGAANEIARLKQICVGPSPLARGSRKLAKDGRIARGSIPARAGQPRQAIRRSRSAGVHPRSRGAAEPLTRTTYPSWGPSPLARGSPGNAVANNAYSGSIPARAGQPAVLHVRRWQRGSIPARAGQPPSPSGRFWSSGVHPRSRGAAAAPPAAASAPTGPSPLARGSPYGGC